MKTGEVKKQEIERKWVLNRFVLPWETLKKGEYNKEKIMQQYVQFPTEENPQEIRVRRSISNGETKYYKTTKSYDENQGMVRDESGDSPEEEITEEEFNSLYDPENKAVVHKTRHSVTLDGITHHIDEYEDGLDLVTVEVEFDTIEEANAYEAPCWYSKEVTNDSAFKNVNIARYGSPIGNKVVKADMTGGPVAGKSTITAGLKIELERTGDTKVLLIREAARDAIEGGAKPWELPNYVFQSSLVNTMLTEFKNWRAIAEEYRIQGYDVLIIADRGLADNRAYSPDTTLEVIMNERGTSLKAIPTSADAVFYIESTAYGAEEVFLREVEKDPTRAEKTVEDGRSVEDNTKKAWSGQHDNIYFFGNNEKGLKPKETAIINAAQGLLGKVPTIKRDERYLVDIPEDLTPLEVTNSQKIEQVYLISKNGSERRIRKIGEGPDATYEYVEKKGKGKERELRGRDIISMEKYYTLLEESADPTRRPIRKTRHSFVQGQEFFVVDIYDEEYPGLPAGKAIVESKATTELKDKPVLPQGFDNLEEITGREEFNNVTIAMKSGKNMFRGPK
ncbi:MAG: AAA family ATPase [Oscillospiraceae bacterium]|nr:AAA family ATPase [Oscillospiraceae bacterium]